MHSCSRLLMQKLSKPYTSRTPEKPNSAHQSVHVSLKKGKATDIHYCENALTYEVSPGGFVCTDAVVDERNQPLKQPVRGKSGQLRQVDAEPRETGITEYCLHRLLRRLSLLLGIDDLGHAVSPRAALCQGTWLHNALLACLQNSHS